MVVTLGSIFKELVHKEVHQIEHLLRKRNASKYVNWLLNLVIFCMVTMLVAILKNKFYEDARKVEQILRKVEQILRKKYCVKIQ